jgi:hypothetical protein
MVAALLAIPDASMKTNKSIIIVIIISSVEDSIS